jgi:L-seryl-tRNA(Ser) seleniumtransferase
MSTPVKRASAPERTDLLRRLPSVDELLLRPGVAEVCRRLGHSYAVNLIREVLDELRHEIKKATADESQVGDAAIERRIVDAVESELAPSIRPVINASGVILHTNLGRAPLIPAAIEQWRETATRYSNLEYDVAAGVRGKRDVHLERLIQRLTGAEAAIVVNNCAAAVLVTLAALARNGEVIVSRGELIEIGDGFRIPEIMQQSGAILREVGTTNRTRIADYENAINEQTRVLLRVHPSNFKMTGFTEKPRVAELMALGERRALPVIEDLGSGCLADLSAAGVHEPTVRESIEQGFSLVLFSGDKLLGGPQAGIIAGKKELVAKVRRHPLFRALRVDKLTIAAMETTLRAYLRGAWNEIPAQAMIRMPLETIVQRTEALLASLRSRIGVSQAQIEIIDGHSLVGGGSTPAQSIPTKLLRITSSRHSAADVESRLRQDRERIPVIARIEQEAVLVDLRTVFANQEASLTESLVAALL